MILNRRRVGLAIFVVACLGTSAYLLYSRPFDPGSDDFRDVVRYGPRVPVMCINPECGHTGKMRAKVDDDQWPKPCPVCGQSTLYRSCTCPHCLGQTAMKHDGKGLVTCTCCGRTFQLLLRGQPPSDDSRIGTQ